MRFSIGYQLPDDFDSTSSICRDYSNDISNVYFSWGMNPSGRSPLCFDRRNEEAVKEIQLYELEKIKNSGISLTLLFNANCYGQDALSVELKDKTIETVSFLKNKLDIDKVTTTSPFIAESIKNKFHDSIDVVASVNMRIGTIQAMEQLSSCFDGFYIQKEHNRNLNLLKRFKQWCNENGKSLSILANSGCLAFCGFQTFHDNVVAHESEILKNKNIISKFPAPCWKYLNELDKKQMLIKIIQSNWIRPEEVSLYEPYFDEMKLATRMHSRARMVINAYIKGRFVGNTLDLTEPSYSSLAKGMIIDNTLFPSDWSSVATNCNHECDKCNVCKNVVEIAMRII